MFLFSSSHVFCTSFHAWPTSSNSGYRQDCLASERLLQRVVLRSGIESMVGSSFVEAVLCVEESLEQGMSQECSAVVKE